MKDFDTLFVHNLDQPNALDMQQCRPPHWVEIDLYTNRIVLVESTSKGKIFTQRGSY